MPVVSCGCFLPVGDFPKRCNCTLFNPPRWCREWCNLHLRCCYYTCLVQLGFVFMAELILRFIWKLFVYFTLALECFLLCSMCLLLFDLIDRLLVCICPSLLFACGCFHLLVIFPTCWWYAPMEVAVIFIWFCEVKI